MMNPMTGKYEMLAATTLDVAAAELAARTSETEAMVLVHGTEQQIQDLSKRVRLGNTELEKRRARRQQQKQSRRANR